jgi:hypothetical protein
MIRNAYTFVEVPELVEAFLHLYEMVISTFIKTNEVGGGGVNLEPGSGERRNYGVGNLQRARTEWKDRITDNVLQEDPQIKLGSPGK